MTEKQYNGWTNYETWLMALWIDNDEWLSDEVNRIIIDNNTKEAHEIGKQIEWYIEELEDVSDVTKKSGFVSDLLTAAMSEINWSEIAKYRFEEI